MWWTSWQRPWSPSSSCLWESGPQRNHGRHLALKKSCSAPTKIGNHQWIKDNFYIRGVTWESIYIVNLKIPSFSRFWETDTFWVSKSGCSRGQEFGRSAVQRIICHFSAFPTFPTFPAFPWIDGSYDHHGTRQVILRWPTLSWLVVPPEVDVYRRGHLEELPWQVGRLMT